MNPPRLPTELIVTIAELLAGDLALGSVAKLNLACRAIHQETLPVLFDTVVWGKTNSQWWIHRQGREPKGWKWTRFVRSVARGNMLTFSRRYLILEKDQLKSMLDSIRLISEKRNTRPLQA